MKKYLIQVMGLFLLLPLVLPSKALAAPNGPSPELAEGRCESPRAALFTSLYWLQEARLDRQRASACFDRSGLAEPEAETSAVAPLVKRYLDTHGLWVQWNDISNDKNYVNEDGQALFRVYPETVPHLAIKRVDSRWLITPESLAQIKAHFEVREQNSLIRLLPSWAEKEILGIELWQMAALLTIVLLGIFLRKTLSMALQWWLSRGRSPSSNHWLNLILQECRRPLSLLVVLMLFSIALPWIGFKGRYESIFTVAIKTMVAFSFAWLLYRLIDVFAAFLYEKAKDSPGKLEEQYIPMAKMGLKFIVIVFGVVFVLHNLQVDVASLMAGLGLGGLAFALAAKDTAANLFGSMMIFLDKPFQVGDWIKLSDAVAGTVVEVGFRSTKLRTDYDTVITVPNANVTNTHIDNYGARRFRNYNGIVQLDVRTPPDKVEAFCEAVRASCLAMDHIRKDYFMFEFREFGDHSLKIFIWAFFRVPNWAAELRVRTNLNLTIMRIAREMDIRFALPTQVVHLESTPAEPHHAPFPSEDKDKLRRSIDRFAPGGDLVSSKGLGVAGRYEPSDKG